MEAGNQEGTHASAPERRTVSRLLGLSPAAMAAPAMRALWSDGAMLQAMLDVEAALARAAVSCGLAQPDEAVVVQAACQAGLYDLDELAAGSLRAGTPTIPLVKALTAEVSRRSPAATVAVHPGATSQDIADTALVLQWRHAMDLIRAQGAHLRGALRALAREYAATPILGRTLLQPGPPVTFGLKAAGWEAAVHRSLLRLDDASDAAFLLQYGGAVGTLASLDGRGAAMAAALGRELGLHVPPAPWHAHRDRLASLASAAAILGGVLGKMARDLSLLAQAELDEAAEPGGNGRGGSSAMPHKRNPVACVVALAAANRLPGLLASLLAGLPQEHERAAGAWQAEASVHADIAMSVSGALDAMIEAADGLQVHPEKMAANIERMRGLVLAERLSARLAPAMGRGRAHAFVEELTKEAARTGEHLREVAGRRGETAGIDLAAVFDPAGTTGEAERFTAALLDSAEG